MSDKVTTRWVENMQFESINPSGDVIRIDAAKHNGGDSMGSRPKALMLSALAGCSGLDVAHLIKKMRLEVDNFKIETEGVLSNTEPETYTEVLLDYHFYGENLDEAKLERAVNLSVENYCGVMNMFKEFSTVEFSVHFHKK